MKIKNEIKQNFFYYSNVHYAQKKWTWKSKLLVYSILLAFLVAAFILIGFQTSPLGFDIFTDRLKQIFSFSNQIEDYPNQSLILLSFNFLWISIKTALIGTVLGFLIAFITSTLQNDKLHNIKAIAVPIRIVIPFLRAMPVIFFIYFFSYTFTKDIALVMVYMWFSWIWSHKYLSEYYDSLNYKFYDYSLYEGNNHFFAYFKNILPQLNNKMISLFLYSFDSNMRWSSLLGTLGMVGIGELIYRAQDNKFESMGIPVLTIMIFMLLLEGFIYLVNRFVLTQKSKIVTFENFEKFYKYKNPNLFLKIFLVLILLTVLIASFATIDWSQSSISGSSFLATIFNPNWNIVNENHNINIGFDILMIFLQTLTVMFLGVIIGIFFIFICSYKILKSYSLIGLTILTILRSVPLIAFFFVINPIYADPISTICIVLGLYCGLNISKTMNESVNKIDEKQIYIYELEGCSRVKIFFKFILFKIFFDLINIIMFSWENQIRDIVTYGKYGSCTIGVYIDTYYSGTKKEMNNVATLIWVSFFINLFFIALFYLIKMYFLENRINRKVIVNSFKKFKFNKV